MKLPFNISMIIIALTAVCLTVQSQDAPFKTKPVKSVVSESMDPDISNQFVKGEITVKLRKGVGDFGKQTGMVRFGIQSLDEKASSFEVSQLEKRFMYNPAKLRADLPDLSRIYKISFPDNFSPDEVVASFATDPNVEYAEPITVGHAVEISNDSLYSQCQHLAQIYAPEAWEIHKGEAGPDDIIIAIIDTGVDWDHVDLQSNIWQNLAEDADNDGHTMEFNGTQWVLDPGDINGIDNDSNGHTDDLIGWNFFGNNNNPNPYPQNPLFSHGTHCAGIAAGVTNNGKGIASISYNLTVMPLCVDQLNTFPYAWDGIIYAAENGADIISNSWGNWSPNAYSFANQEVINYVTGLGSIIVAAAANNNNKVLSYPASYQHVISVASVSFDDTRANYSNYNFAVDISAPGGGSEGGILSTIPGNNYGLMSGTSMATPMIAGCFGLLKSYHPGWSNDQLITQLLGTTDNIDSLNPEYINMLGSGRVNAFRMLSGENVSPFLKLDLTLFNTVDANSNDINEPGELVMLNFDLHNYAPCYGADNVNVSISTTDPDIAIINGTCTINIPPDSTFGIHDQLQIQVGANASCHFADLTLHFEADLPFTMGQDIDFKVLVNPSGIFVFEGEENGQDYSGSFIASFLDHLGFNYTYSNTYTTLKGFETVFLSNGNLGQNLDMGTSFTLSNSMAVQEYLESGGNLYAEMGGMFYRMYYFNYPNKAAMKDLFGVSMLTTSNSETPVDTLRGVSGTPMVGMLFNSSDQLYNWHIDKMTPKTGALIPFFEQDYGNISILNSGPVNNPYKSFYMGYSLADLHDRNVTSSRYNVLIKTMEFFGYSMPQGYLLSNFIADKTIGGIGMVVHFSDISIGDPAYPVTSWQWDFNNDGSIDSYDQNPVWTYNSPGNQSVRLIISNGTKSDTLTREGFITINSGIFVYESVAGGYDLSGSFIRDQLQGKAYPVTYQNTFPKSLEGYSAAFISFGDDVTGGAYLEAPLAKIITDYLEGGGYVYLEGAALFGWFVADNPLFFDLFGIESAVYLDPANPIDSLGGQPDAITNEMLFTGNTQLSNRYLDTYEPALGAVAAFVESDFGIVGVQYSVPDSHRTFCFAYCLADLSDGEIPNTREELLNRILNFFDIYTDVSVMPEPTGLNCKVYPNPVTSSATIQYDLPADSQIILDLFNATGQRISQPVNDKQMEGVHSVQWDTHGLPAGVYYYTLRAGKQQSTGKIIIIK